MRQGEIRRGRQDEDGLDRIKQGKGNTRQGKAKQGKRARLDKPGKTRQEKTEKRKAA